VQQEKLPPEAQSAARRGRSQSQSSGRAQGALRPAPVPVPAIGARIVSRMPVLFGVSSCRAAFAFRFSLVLSPVSISHLLCCLRALRTR